MWLSIRRDIANWFFFVKEYNFKPLKYDYHEREKRRESHLKFSTPTIKLDWGRWAQFSRHYMDQVNYNIVISKSKIFKRTSRDVKVLIKAKFK